MPGLQDAGRMLEGAEQAALAADFESAGELLRGAARIQEAELGPVHPDLANTFNNLAVVAERAGRLDEAEAFYRRAVAIAAASLPAEHPMIAASRDNLEAFCRARGLPVEAPDAAAVSLGDALTEPEPDPFDELDPGSFVELELAPPPRIDSPRPIIAAISPAAAPSLPARRSMRTAIPVSIAVYIAVSIAVALMIWRLWSSPGAPPGLTATAPSGANPAPLAEAAAQAAPPVTSPSPAVVALTAVELCQAFSTRGESWRCDPAGDCASPGALVLYTRVRSASDGVVVHRWYRGETLTQAVRLRTQANARQGYRT